MKRLALLLAALLPGVAAAAENLQDVMAILARHAVVRADYTQRKHVAGRKHDFLSSGALVFVRHQGVLLTMKSPATSQLVMTAATIVVRTARRTTRINPAQSPFGPAAMVFGQLAGGDLQLLQQNFAVASLATHDGSWHLQLKPLAAPMKKALASLELAGDEYLRTITLVDPRGGQVALQLDHHQTQPDTLGTDELELFHLAQ